ncbi:MAG TPA: hypothetical protein PLP05_12540, partial [Sedimentisphaerales bacterium]|nr:hypothetical protein [Sedimentisphaerales bacterium]
MRLMIRYIMDKTFTLLTVLSVIVLICILAIVLTPMLQKGGAAICFKGTVEFRKMQIDLFRRGNSDKINEQIKTVNACRAKIYEMIDRFKQNIDPQQLCERASKISRDYGKELGRKEIAGAQYQENRTLCRQLRDDLQQAFNSSDRQVVESRIAEVLKYKDDAKFKDTSAAEMFTLAQEFLSNIKNVDLTKRQQYADGLKEFEDILVKLLGPRAGETLPALSMDRYGATRMDIADKLLGQLLWAENWVHN